MWLGLGLLVTSQVNTHAHYLYDVYLDISMSISLYRIYPPPTLSCPIACKRSSDIL